jgi:hypothetical protein
MSRCIRQAARRVDCVLEPHGNRAIVFRRDEKQRRHPRSYLRASPRLVVSTQNLFLAPRPLVGHFESVRPSRVRGPLDLTGDIARVCCGRHRGGRTPVKLSRRTTDARLPARLDARLKERRSQNERFRTWLSKRHRDRRTLHPRAHPLMLVSSNHRARGEPRDCPESPRRNRGRAGRRLPSGLLVTWCSLEC